MSPSNPLGPTEISIIVPTFHEVENIDPLVKAIDRVLKDAELSYELIVVDDSSNDGIEEKLAELGRTFPVQLITRQGKPPDLSAAVLDGLYCASGQFALVMDADLSHPPEVIPHMIKVLESREADFVIGSRYVDGGAFDAKWNAWRFLNSTLATAMVKPLVRVSDPMSGYFCCRREDIPARSVLRPIGYKIGLELMIRGKFNKIAEVPILFRDRHAGVSKMNLRQQLKYLEHLRRLYVYKFKSTGELLNFLAVGACGFVIDLSFYLVLQALGADHRLARAISFWPAVSSNWFLNRTTTFGERARRPKLRQWLEFTVSSLLGFGINWGTYYLLTTHFDFFDLNRILTFFIGIVFGAISNFVIASMYVYNDKRSN